MAKIHLKFITFANRLNYGVVNGIVPDAYYCKHGVTEYLALYDSLKNTSEIEYCEAIAKDRIGICGVNEENCSNASHMRKLIAQNKHSKCPY